MCVSQIIFYFYVRKYIFIPSIQDYMILRSYYYEYNFYKYTYTYSKYISNVQNIRANRNVQPLRVKEVHTRKINKITSLLLYKHGKIKYINIRKIISIFKKYLCDSRLYSRRTMISEKIHFVKPLKAKYLFFNYYKRFFIHYRKWYWFKLQKYWKRFYHHKWLRGLKNLFIKSDLHNVNNDFSNMFSILNIYTSVFSFSSRFMRNSFYSLSKNHLKYPYKFNLDYNLKLENGNKKKIIRKVRDYTQYFTNNSYYTNFDFQNRYSFKSFYSHRYRKIKKLIPFSLLFPIFRYMNTNIISKYHSFISIIKWLISLYITPYKLKKRISLLFDRNIHFSLYKLRFVYYNNYHVIDPIGTSLPIFKKQNYNQNILFDNKKNIAFFSFSYKFFYSMFLYHFLSSFYKLGFFTDTFFFRFMQFLKLTYNESSKDGFNYILSLRNVRVSFIYFLTGSYISRISFYFFNSSETLPIYFFFRLCSRYHYIFINILFIHLKQDIFLYIILLSSNRSSYSDTKFRIVFLHITIKIISFFTMYLNLIEVESYNKDALFFVNSYIVGKSNFIFHQHILYISFIHLLYNINYHDIQYFLQNKSFTNLSYQIEASLVSSNEVLHFFYGRFCKEYMPPLFSSKMLCDYIIFLFREGNSIHSIFEYVYQWQLYWQRFTDYYTNLFIRDFNLNLTSFFYSVKGIRVLLSGPDYKGNRTVTKKYHAWLSDDFYTGRMPLSTMDSEIDYYQSFVIIKSTNIGIKVWLLFDNSVFFQHIIINLLIY